MLLFMVTIQKEKNITFKISGFKLQIPCKKEPNLPKHYLANIVKIYAKRRGNKKIRKH